MSMGNDIKTRICIQLLKEADVEQCVYKCITAKLGWVVRREDNSGVRFPLLQLLMHDGDEDGVR